MTALFCFPRPPCSSPISLIATPVLEVAVAEEDTTQGGGETQKEAEKAKVKV